MAHSVAIAWGGAGREGGGQSGTRRGAVPGPSGPNLTLASSVLPVPGGPKSSSPERCLTRGALLEPSPSTYDARCGVSRK